MNRLIITNSVLVLVLFVYSCSKITESSIEPEMEFEKEYFITDGEVINTYRSLDVISIQLKPDINLNDFNNYIDEMGLQLLWPFTHEQYSSVTEINLQGRSLIILLLPPNADHNQFYSFSENLTADSFANNPFIKYSLPAYTHDTEQPGWYYPNNEVTVMPSTDDFSATELSEQFDLEFKNKNSQIDMYTFTDHKFLHGSPYELANKIYDSGKYRFVVPGSYREIVRH